MICKDDLSKYTYSGRSDCYGWKNISIQECMTKCTNNDVPSAACQAREDVTCAYVQYTRTTRWCHLADHSCEPVQGHFNYTVLERQGQCTISTFQILHHFVACLKIRGNDHMTPAIQNFRGREGLIKIAMFSRKSSQPLSYKMLVWVVQVRHELEV